MNQMTVSNNKMVFVIAPMCKFSTDILYRVTVKVFNKREEIN
jgi:hypothetical protein